MSAKRAMEKHRAIVTSGTVITLWISIPVAKAMSTRKKGLLFHRCFKHLSFQMHLVSIVKSEKGS